MFAGSSSLKNQYFYWVNSWNNLQRKNLKFIHSKFRENNGQRQLIAIVDLWCQSITCHRIKRFTYISNQIKKTKQLDSNLRHQWFLVCLKEIIQQIRWREMKKKQTLFFLTECNRNYTRPQGRLLSKSIADCEAYIQVPSNYMISLYFMSMDFKLATPCTDDNKPLKVNRFFHLFFPSLNFFYLYFFLLNISLKKKYFFSPDLQWQQQWASWIILWRKYTDTTFHNDQSAQVEIQKCHAIIYFERTVRYHLCVHKQR